jgi:hypothetical protein
MSIAVFGGLSPLRGPLATALAETRDSEAASTTQQLPARVNEGGTEYEAVGLAQLN